MCANSINHYPYFQEVFLPLLYEQISGRKRMIYFVDKRFVEKEIWNIKKCILLNVRFDESKKFPTSLTFNFLCFYKHFKITSDKNSFPFI